MVLQVCPTIFYIEQCALGLLNLWCTFKNQHLPSMFHYLILNLKIYIYHGFHIIYTYLF